MRATWKRKGIRGLLMPAVLAMTALGLAACSSSSSSSSKTSSASATASAVKGTFYELYQSCPSNPFWGAVNNGARAAAAQLGVSLKIEDPLRCSGEEAQENSLLTTIINSHPAGIAVSVPYASALSANIQRARSLHIPIIAYNSIPPNNNYSVNPVEAYVGQPNYTAGVDLGKQLVSQYHLTSGDTIMVADQCYTNTTCNARYQGVESVVDPLGVKVSVLNLDYSVPTSAGIVKSFLQTHSRPTLVVALGSAGEEEVVDAAQALGLKPSQLPMVGFDDDAVTNTYMIDGWVKLTVDQQPFLQGYDALVDLYDAVRYQAYPINMDTGPVFVTHTANDIAKGWFNPSVVSNTGI
ncbi:substrate-binding domain-containing protein [Aciditerrimonas ferrireducens]|uniref:substrate-binding domain-containing protein n=1 Tax=Aciditerrimonas ferrireducens TaxID=667306 RepID=UPI00200430A5|nr:substrate-binding domain-containing protein [Aciditerrimonas ferrireducens]MCK4177512.1 substrate-binding domain-containing protein [Aciditerrimonas ferrireducens]